MKKITFLFLFMISALGFSQTDECAGATPVACDETVTGSTATATDSGGNSNPAADVWYSYTGSGVAEDVTIDLCASGYDTAVRVYSDCSVSSGSQVLFNDDNPGVCGPGFRSYGTFASDGTTTYYILIEGYNTTTGNYSMTVTCAPNIPAPANDLCSNAEALALDTPTSGTTAGATDSSTSNDDDTSCESFSFKSDVWYTFVSPGTAVSVNTTITGDSDQANVAVYSSLDCSQLDADSIACSAGNGGESVDVTGLTNGNTYYIRVWSDGVAARQPSNGRTEGTFIIEVVSPAEASDCAETPITPLDGATDVPAFDTFELSWTAPSAGPTPTSYNIYVGNMSDGSDQALFQNTTETSYTVFVGAEFTTLYWSVRPLNGITESTGCDLWSFTTGATPAAPANDNLCNATALTVDATSAGNAYYDINATAEAGEVIGSCFNGDINGSTWFTFVAPSSGDVQVSTDIPGGTHGDTEIAVYEAPSDCNDASSLGAELGCSQDVVANFLSTVEITGLTAGNTYYIQVDRWGTADPGYFGIEVMDMATLSTEDLQANNQELFTYFPNPVSNNLTIKAQKNIQNITVFNMLGQTVINNVPNAIESNVDMSALKSGAYFVKVTVDNQTETIRIIRN